MKRWPAFAVLFALLAGAAFLAWRNGLATVQSWLTYQPPASAAAPATPGAAATAPATALTSRLVVVIVGGLRSDTALELPTLNLLRQRGAFRTLVADTPTETTTTWATLLTGTDPDLHGQLSDASVRALAADTIFDEAKSQGLTTALAGPDTWGQLLPRSVDLPALEPAAGAEPDEALFQHAVTAVQAKAGLTLVYLSDTAAAGRRYGGASPSYQAAAARADARLAQLLEHVDLAGTTLLVTSDHGLTAAGGSGGSEPEVVRVPLVAAGKGITAGLMTQGRQRDLAPTVAALLGLPSPASATGTALLDMLAFPSPDDARAVARLEAERQTALLRSLVDRMGGQLQTPATLPQDPAAAAGYVRELQRSAADAQRYHWWLQVKGRLPWAGGLALLLALYLLLLVRQPYGRGVLAGALIYFAVYYALFLGPWRMGPFAPQHGLTFSLSRFGTAPYTAFLKQRALESASAAVAAAVLTGLRAAAARSAATAAGESRRPSGGGIPGLHLALAITALLGLQALAFWSMYGVPFDAALPPVPWLVKHLLDLVQLVAVAVASPFMAMAAAVVFRVRVPASQGSPSPRSGAHPAQRA